MANNNAALVSVGKPQVAGALYAAASTAAVPTDAKTTPAADFKKLGYVSDDGLTNAIDAKNSDIVAWGGDTVLTVTESRAEALEWSFIQSLDADVLAEVYGVGNVTSNADGITVLHNGKEMPRRAYVIDILMTGGAKKRIVVPNGQITKIDDVTYDDKDAIAYAVTLSCYPDDKGNTVYEYITMPVAQAVAAGLTPASGTDTGAATTPAADAGTEPATDTGAATTPAADAGAGA